MILYILAYVLAIVIIGLLWYFFPREEYTMSTEAHTIMEGEVDKMFPVGTILLTLYAENPAEKIEFLNGTTWKQIESNCALVTENVYESKVGDEDNSSNTFGPFKTNEHKLTIKEFPNHIHGVKVIADDLDSHTHTFTCYYSDDMIDTGGFIIGNDDGYKLKGYTDVTTNPSTAGHYHNYTVSNNDINNKETVAHSHDIRLPYVQFHMWKRI